MDGMFENTLIPYLVLMQQQLSCIVQHKMNDYISLHRINSVEISCISFLNTQSNKNCTQVQSTRIIGNDLVLFFAMSEILFISIISLVCRFNPIKGLSYMDS